MINKRIWLTCPSKIIFVPIIGVTRLQITWVSWQWAGSCDWSPAHNLSIFMGERLLLLELTGTFTGKWGCVFGDGDVWNVWNGVPGVTEEEDIGPLVCRIIGDIDGLLLVWAWEGPCWDPGITSLGDCCCMEGEWGWGECWATSCCWCCWWDRCCCSCCNGVDVGGSEFGIFDGVGTLRLDGILLKLSNPSTADDILSRWSASNLALAAWAACTAWTAIPGSSFIKWGGGPTGLCWLDMAFLMLFGADWTIVDCSAAAAAACACACAWAWE